MKKLPDVQALSSGFNKIAINKVGVRGIRYPFKFGGANVLGDFSLYCNLVSSVKGINMSRMARTVNEWLRTQSDTFADHETLESLVTMLALAHQTDNIYARCRFEYPVQDSTPMSHLSAISVIPVTLESVYEAGKVRNYIQVKYTGMSLCPCSREMSLLKHNLTAKEAGLLLRIRDLDTQLDWKLDNAGFGAHNQRSRVEIKIETIPTLIGAGSSNVYKLCSIASQAVSVPIRSVLKREDEKYVTEVSYSGAHIVESGDVIPVEHTGPKFVEDIARDAAGLLNEQLDNWWVDYVVVVNNEESIHSDDIMATAILSAGRRLV